MGVKSVCEVGRQKRRLRKGEFGALWRAEMALTGSDRQCPNDEKELRSSWASQHVGVAINEGRVSRKMIPDPGLRLIATWGRVV
jgi:hypothetical protein